MIQTTWHNRIVGTGEERPDQKRERKREYDRRRYEERREEKLAQNRKWREENAEKKRELDRQYYEANRERIIERVTAYQADRVEERREYMAAYTEANREQLREHGRQYRADNLERIRENERIRSRDPERRRRHYLTQQVPRRTADKAARITPEQWEVILDAADHKCLCCGASDNLQMDHIVAVKRGGVTLPDNVQPLCKPCNQQKGTKHIDYRTPRVIEVAERISLEVAR